jgi:hypothetical protein
MPFRPPPRLPAAAACVLAAGLMLTAASCSHLTPLGPDAAATLPRTRPPPCRSHTICGHRSSCKPCASPTPCPSAPARPVRSRSPPPGAPACATARPACR